MATLKAVQENSFDPIEFINNSNQRPLADLLANLIRAQKAFDSSGPDHDRTGVYQALRGIIQYLGEIAPGRPDLAVPLRELLYALRGLDDGAVVPLLKPVELAHRPPIAISQGAFRADAAALMELKVAELRAGKRPKYRDQAAGTVARRLNRLGFRDAGSRILGKEVADWRDRVRKGAQKPDYQTKRYFSVLQQVRARFPDAPKAAYELLVNLMIDMYPASIPKKVGLNSKGSNPDCCL